MKHTGIVTELKPNQVFVFGSNEAGRHGRGAAFTAKKWGAKNGYGFGHHGQTYALPTKDWSVRVLPLGKIRRYVDEFILYARDNPNLEFLVTEIGCGLAGYSPKEIAPFFIDIPHNVVLPKSFQLQLA